MMDRQLVRISRCIPANAKPANVRVESTEKASFNSFKEFFTNPPPIQTIKQLKASKTSSENERNGLKVVSETS